PSKEACLLRHLVLAIATCFKDHLSRRAGLLSGRRCLGLESCGSRQSASRRFLFTEGHASRPEKTGARSALAEVTARRPSQALCHLEAVEFPPEASGSFPARRIHSVVR